jgi:hypothetical protein
VHPSSYQRALALSPTQPRCRHSIRACFPLDIRDFFLGVVLLISRGRYRVISDGFSRQEELGTFRDVAWCPVLRQFGERNAVDGRLSYGFTFPKGLRRLLRTGGGLNSRATSKCQ